MLQVIHIRWADDFFNTLLVAELNSYELGGLRLGEVVEQFESLALIRNIWIRYEVPAAIRSTLPKITAVWAYADEYLDPAIRLQLKDVREEIHREVQKFRKWQLKWSRLVGAMEEVHTRLENDEGTPPDPMRDLGLVRWGMRLSDAGQEKLQEYIAIIYEGDISDRASLCIDLATALEDPGVTEESFTVVCATCWFLGAYDLLVEGIQHYKDHVETVDMSIFVIETAAQLRATPQMAVREKHALLQNLEHLETAASAVGSGGYLLGLGYSYYVAWKSATAGVAALPDSEVRLVAEWARASFLAGVTGVKYYPPNTLEWAFSVNHAVYVGAVTQQSTDDFLEYVDMLVRLRGEPRFWHYRFADTLAYHDLVVAKMQWGLAGLNTRAKDRAAAKSRVCARLHHAISLLADASHCFGDPEIPQHELEIVRFFNEVGCEAR